MPVAPLKPELGLLAFVKLPPAPETMLHEPLPTLAALAAKVVQEAGKKPKPSHYKIVCISLYNEDIARLESLVAELKRRGYSKANKSQLIRAALEQIDLDKVPKIP